MISNQKQVENEKFAEIGYLSEEFDEKSKIYAHTNEKLNSLVEDIGAAESVLTVASSGDHLLNLLVKGIYNIDTFDINSLTKYYIDLRLSGIKYIDDLSSLYFFLLGIYKHGYEECKNGLDYKTYIFWDRIFKRYTMDEIKTKLFRPYDDPIAAMDYNNYLDMDALKILKNNVLKLKNNHYSTHLFNLFSFIKDKKYDAIILSNIFDYVDTTKFFRFIRLLKENLNPEGKLYYSYQYAVTDEANVRDLILRKDFKLSPEEDDLGEFDDLIEETKIVTLKNNHLRSFSEFDDAVLVLKK